MAAHGRGRALTWLGASVAVVATSSNGRASSDTARTRPIAARSPAFDSSAQLEVVRDSLLENEQLYGAYASTSAGIALVGVTNKRVILLDRAYPGGRVALMTVPFKAVTTVSYVSTDDEPIFSSTIALQVGRTFYEFTCRTEQQAADVHDLISWHVLDF